MDSLESEDEREKKSKLEEMTEGKSTRPSEDAMFLRTEIIDAIKRSDEKMEAYSKKQTKTWTSSTEQWKITKTDEQMDTFLRTITVTVGTQLHGMNSTIAKVKEEEDDRYRQINERMTKTERNILDMDEKYENRNEEPRGTHVDRIRVKL